ncbi:MAG: sensor histidine kinase [Candidatus Thorarchaeota archaeon]
MTQLKEVSHLITCLWSVSKLLSDTERDMCPVLSDLAHLLLESSQRPSEASARITVEDKDIRTSNYKDTQWKRSTDIWASDVKVGSLEICYDSEFEGEDSEISGGSLFIETVAAELGKYIERKQLDRIRWQQYRELELYASLMRHDLRNDLGVILGNLDVARMAFSGGESEVTDILSSIEAVCDRMLSLVESLAVSEQPLDIGIAEHIKLISSRAEAANPNLTIKIRVDGNARDSKTPKSRLLPLVFDNLLRNASIHAGESPVVTILIRRKESKICITVSDNGPGVPREVRENLFQRGVSTRGGGLGLYLSREVLKALGGSIDLVDSEGSTGATFFIEIPSLK